ncbi:hypothetical protein J6590_061849 [Homalodisca vitripennis]|nr:hypothetical protein J6590_061849 [Homalodisca vitripennis]
MPGALLFPLMTRAFPPAPAPVSPHSCDLARTRSRLPSDVVVLPWKHEYIAWTRRSRETRTTRHCPHHGELTAAVCLSVAPRCSRGPRMVPQLGRTARANGVTAGLMCEPRPRVDDLQSSRRQLYFITDSRSDPWLNIRSARTCCNRPLTGQPFLFDSDSYILKSDFNALPTKLPDFSMAA